MYKTFQEYDKSTQQRTHQQPSGRTALPIHDLDRTMAFQVRNSLRRGTVPLTSELYRPPAHMLSPTADEEKTPPPIPVPVASTSSAPSTFLILIIACVLLGIINLIQLVLLIVLLVRH